MNNENKTIRSVALYRILAMLVVLYYHLVEIPSYSLEIINVTKSPLPAPILPETAFSKVGLLIYYRLHVDMGSLAVVMFFIASGYLISRMMERYSRREFLVNRAISTFPTLWVSLIVIAVFVGLSQGIVFTPKDFLASMFPFWPVQSGAFISAVLWTMRIELKFYILAALFWKNRKAFVTCGYILIILMSTVYYEFRTPAIHAQMLDIQFMCFSFLGVIIEDRQRALQEGGNRRHKYEYLQVISACVLFNLILFKTSAWLFQDGGDRMSYPNCVTQILPVLLFVLLVELEQHFPAAFQKIPRHILAIGKPVLPYYLTHVACGLIAMMELSQRGCGVIVTLLGGWVTAFIVAVVIYVLVTRPSGVLMKKIIRTMRKEQ